MQQHSVQHGRGSLPLPGASFTTTNRLPDQLFRFATSGAALVVLAMIILFVYQMVTRSWPSIQAYGFDFITGTTWNPVMDEFGALPLIWGTLITSIVALVIALPISLGVAIFLSDLAPPWIRRPITFLVEMLASIPSIVYGLWGLFVLVPLVRAAHPTITRYLGFIPLFDGPPFGFGVLAAGIVLAIMIIPIITSLSREAFDAVPSAQREAALALGSTRWEMIRHTVLPYNKTGIIGAVVWGLGRALGETMAVTMVIGNQSQIHASLFMPAQTMASLLASEFAEASGGILLSALTEIGLLLFLVTLVMNIFAKLLMGRLSGRGRSK